MSEASSPDGREQSSDGRPEPSSSDDRPEPSASRRGEPGTDRTALRGVLAVGIVVGIGWAVISARATPAQVGVASDVYYHAGRAVLAGGDLYGVTPPAHPDFRYLYPPVVALAFLPHALAGSELAALALQAAASVAAGLATAGLVRRALGRRGVALARVDEGLLAGFCVLSVHALPLTLMGQVTVPLAAAVAYGADAVERDRPTRAGVAFGAAALVKLFPATVGLWLLRRRADRAVGAATATGLGGLLLGALALGPALTREYLLVVVPGQSRAAAFAGAPGAARNFTTAQRQLAALLPVDPGLLGPLAAAVLALPVAVLYRDLGTDVRRLAALLGTLVATLLALPLEPLYFPVVWYPLVVLLYALPRGRARATLLAGTLGSFLLVDLSTVRLAAAALPPEGQAAVLAAARGLLSVIQPATVGLWLLLAGCLLVTVDG